MTKAPISVVIAASTRPDLIGDCLASVLGQHVAPSEILIATTPGSNVEAQLSHVDNINSIPIRILRSGNSPSVAADLNTALPAARADLISFLTTDVCWHHDMLRMLQEGIGECGWSFSGITANTNDDPLQTIIEYGTDIESLLFKRELALNLTEFDPSTSPLEYWDAAIAFGLQSSGRHVGDETTQRQPLPTAKAAAVAQILRKYAGSLRARLDNFDVIANDLLSRVAEHADAIVPAQRSLSKPYLQLDHQHGSKLTFLISLPRSGSTLLQHILAGHPDIYSLPEPWIMLNLCHGRRGSELESNYEPALATRALDGFLANAGDSGSLYADSARAMSDRLYDAALAGTGKRIFLDKTPRYFHILSELREIYPAARYVFLLRHPLAVLTSTLKTWFDGDVKAFMENKNALDCFDGPRRIYEAISALGSSAVCIQYENLVADPGSEVQQLCDRIGLSFDNIMIDYSTAEMPTSDFGDQTNVSQFEHPVTDFVDSWQECFTDETTAKLGRDLLDYLGAETFNGLGYDFEHAYRIVNTTTSTSVDGTQSADRLTLDGETFFANGDLDSARLAFEDALKLDAKFPTALNNLGVLNSQLGHADTAITYFISALESDPTERNALVNLIESANTADRLSDTLTSLANYLTAVPDDSEIARYAEQITNAIENQACAQPPTIDVEEVPTMETLPRAPMVLIPNQQPRLTIVTPSFNQGDYLEACIDSILSQNYPNLEYIIMDGASTDQSVSIIKRHQKYLTHWQSQPDGGQYAAVEAGFMRSTGEIMAWLNSDDKYHPDALWKVAYAFTTRPQVEWLTGLYTFWDQYGTLTGVLDPVYWSRKKQLDPNKMTTVQQESTFWRRSLWDKAGARLATDLYYAGDWDLWTRFFALAKLHTLEWTLGGYRYHEGQKVGNDSTAYTAEAEILREREVAAITAQGVELVDETPSPIRLDDPALIEIADWREASPPMIAYRSPQAVDHAKPKGKRRSATRKPSINIVTSLRSDAGEEQMSAVKSWLSAGWRVTSVNASNSVDELGSNYPELEFIATEDFARLENNTDAIKLSCLLAAAATATEDYIGIIKPDVIIDKADQLSATVGSYSAPTLIYGDKLAVNSTIVLDGIADGYGYFFCPPTTLATFSPGELTFGQDWWVHWLLMSAIAKDYPVQKIEDVYAYRIRKSIKAVLAEQIISSRACISSVLAQYLPSEFRSIPSLKLSFDIETSDFEQFARSFIASRAA